MGYIPRVEKHILEFPNPNFASPEGIVAYGGDLTPSRLLLAYRKGIFPWYNEDDPILWWSPNPRMVLLPHEFKLSKSLEKKIKRGVFEVRIDSCFKDVVENCGKVPRAGQEGSWIHKEVVDAYCELHDMGYAHSFETFFDGELVGGLYGVSLGRAFFGESMFAKKSDASKVAFAELVAFVIREEFDFIDAQVRTPHLLSLGAKEVSRGEFLMLLERTLKKNSRVGIWEKSIGALS